MLNHMAACCHVHRHRFPYLSCTCVSSSLFVLAMCLPHPRASTSNSMFSVRCVGRGGSSQLWPRVCSPFGLGRSLPVGIERLVIIVVWRSVPIVPGVWGAWSRLWWGGGSRLCQGYRSRLGLQSLVPIGAGNWFQLWRGDWSGLGLGGWSRCPGEAGACP